MRNKKLKFVSSLLLLTALQSAYAQENSDNKPANQSGKASTNARNLPTARNRLRYQGKTFQQWIEVLEVDLAPDVRKQALPAIAAFGKHGFKTEVFHQLRQTITLDESPEVREAAFKLMGQFSADHPDDLFELALDRVKKDGYDRNARGVVADLLFQDFNKTAMKLLPLLDDESTQTFASSALVITVIDKQLVNTDRSKATISTIAEISEKAVPILTKQLSDGSENQKKQSLGLLIHLTDVLRSNERYTADPKSKIQLQICSVAISNAISDSALRNDVLATSIAMGIRSPKLARQLEKWLEEESLPLKTLMANFEDPEPFWKEVDQMLLNAMRSSSRSAGSQDDPAKMNVSRVVDLVRAIGIQGQDAKSAMPLLEMVTQSIDSVNPPPRMSKMQLGGVFDAAIASIRDDASEESIAKLQASWSIRDIFTRSRSNPSSRGTTTRSSGIVAPTRSPSRSRPSPSGRRIP